VRLVIDIVRSAAAFAVLDAEGRGWVGGATGSIRLLYRVEEIIRFDVWDAGSFYVYIYLYIHIDL